MKKLAIINYNHYPHDKQTLIFLKLFYLHHHFKKLLTLDYEDDLRVKF